jgi:hypothetical protein
MMGERQIIRIFIYLSAVISNKVPNTDRWSLETLNFSKIIQRILKRYNKDDITDKIK